MRLVQQTIIRSNKDSYKDIKDLCHRSKNLYNTTLFAIRQHYFEHKSYLPYIDIDRIFKSTNNIDYRSLPSQTAQQTMRIVDQSFRSFFKSLKLPGKHHIPNYKDKNGLFTVTYTNQQISKKSLKEGYISVPSLNHKFPTTLTDICQVRFIPKSNYIVMEVVYEIKEKEKKTDNNRYAAIDLGIDNLATLTFHDDKPIIINGRPIKSINQYYNKQKSKYQAIKATKKIEELSFKRNNKIRDYFHKSSRFITNQLVSGHYNTVIIGYNKCWKQDVNIGKRNNQSFTSISHLQFVNMIKYKCELEGINVLLTEEAYTSKASALDHDFLPDLNVKDPVFLGKRIKRGLYLSRHGYINADVNGSLNIMRKVVGDGVFSTLSTDRGFVFNPCKISF